MNGLIQGVLNCMRGGLAPYRPLVQEMLQERGRGRREERERERQREGRKALAPLFRMK